MHNPWTGNYPRSLGHSTEGRDYMNLTTKVWRVFFTTWYSCYSLCHQSIAIDEGLIAPGTRLKIIGCSFQ